jgi:hypothetical protein
LPDQVILCEGLDGQDTHLLTDCNGSGVVSKLVVISGFGTIPRLPPPFTMAALAAFSAIWAQSQSWRLLEFQPELLNTP